MKAKHISEHEFILRYGLEAWEKYQLHYGTPKSKLRKTEFVKIYGIDEWNKRIEYHSSYNRQAYKKNPDVYLKSNKKWTDDNQDLCKEIGKRYYEENKEEIRLKAKKRYNADPQKKIEQTERNRIKRRNKGHIYCSENYDCVPGYEEAKKTNFEGFTQHHTLELYFTARQLNRAKVYNAIGPFNLAWLPAREHEIDAKHNNKHYELSKWHKHMFKALADKNEELNIKQITERPITDERINNILHEHATKPLFED